jgi:hypothetical protein
VVILSSLTARTRQPFPVHCPHLNALAGHVRSFAEIMTGRQDEQELPYSSGTVEGNVNF